MSQSPDTQAIVEALERVASKIEGAAEVAYPVMLHEHVARAAYSASWSGCVGLIFAALFVLSLLAIWRWRPGLDEGLCLVVVALALLALPSACFLFRCARSCEVAFAPNLTLIEGLLR